MGVLDYAGFIGAVTGVASLVWTTVTFFLGQSRERRLEAFKSDLSRGGTAFATVHAKRMEVVPALMDQLETANDRLLTAAVVFHVQQTNAIEIKDAADAACDALRTAIRIAEPFVPDGLVKQLQRHRAALRIHCDMIPDDAATDLPEGIIERIQTTRLELSGLKTALKALLQPSEPAG